MTEFVGELVGLREKDQPPPPPLTFFWVSDLDTMDDKPVWSNKRKAKFVEAESP